METTLNPPPNEAELKEIRAIMVGYAAGHGVKPSTALNYAEAVIAELRSRYGAPKAEPAVEDMTLRGVCEMLDNYKEGGAQFSILICADSSGEVTDMESGEQDSFFSSIPELIKILKGGQNG